MKQFIIILLLFAYSQLHAQTLANKFSREHPVKSVNWGGMSTTFVDGFWEMVMPQLRKVFTKKIADSIERYSLFMSQPAFFRIGKNEARDTLKIYKVAEFNNNFGGSFHGVMYLLMVPFNENKQLWGPADRQNYDFFLVLNKNDVVLEK